MQQSLADNPSEPHASPGEAAGAPRPNPITWPLVLRVLGVGAAVATFLSLFGPFSVPLREAVVRTTLYFAYSWLGSLLGLAGARIAWRLGLWPRGPIVVGLATGLIMAPPMTLVVWLSHMLADGRPPPAAILPNILWDVVLVCVGASVVAMFASWRRRQLSTVAAPPKFLDRLPLKLRGAEVWAVEAEDHYLRLHTSRGQDLILMRLSDAVAELEGLEGAQVHRSWWVARDAIAQAERGDGRATLTLKDGAEVPVSRTYARMLREKNWI
ncbi:LytTR family DNA-binding domain-containing protein [Phenylobacterium sp.]|uniref:LytTR family DNA-binding domain-containing protein n=1 Tax=Phenylobacterium sp. TaxID=1871053 RepID=UPI0039C95315